MSTLTYGNSTFAPAVPEAAKVQRKPLWRRIVNAFIESQERRADREIARMLARHGGLLTDEMEREIMNRVVRNGRAF